jgi:hypothetical protein
MLLVEPARGVAGDRRIADEPSERTEADGRVEQVTHVFLRGDVSPDCECLPAVSPDLLGDTLGRRRVTGVVDDHVAAALGGE